jgi:hypothetical protein
VAGADATPAPKLQADGYRAFLDVWGDLLAEGDPRFAGVCFYEWDPYHAGGPGDTGYGVRGKPALEVLGKYMRNDFGPARR